MAGAANNRYENDEVAEESRSGDGLTEAKLGPMVLRVSCWVDEGSSGLLSPKAVSQRVALSLLSLISGLLTLII